MFRHLQGHHQANIRTPEAASYVRWLNHPEFTITHIDLRTEHTKQPPEYRGRITKRRGCPLGYANILPSTGFTS
jgi:hypothetical protein